MKMRRRISGLLLVGAGLTVGLALVGGAPKVAAEPPNVEAVAPSGLIVQAQARHQAGDYAEAAALWTQALAEGLPEDRPLVQAQLGLARLKLGDVPEAETLLRAGREGALAALAQGDPAAAAVALDATRYLVQLLQRQTRLDEASALLTAARALAATQPHLVVQRLQLLQQQANQHWRQQQWADAFATYRELRDQAVAAARPEQVAGAEEGMGVLLSMMGDDSGAMALTQRACDYKAKAAPGRLAACQANAADVALGAGDAAQALVLADSAVALAERSGERQVHLQALTTRLDALIALGDAGLGFAADTLRGQLRPDDAPSVVQQAHLSALHADAERGAFARFHALEPALALELDRDPLRRAELKLWAARAALAEGDDTAAVGELSRAAEAVEALRAGVPEENRGQFVDRVRASVYALRAQLAAEADDAEAAAAALEEGKARAFIDRLRAQLATLDPEASTDRFALAEVGARLGDRSGAPTPIAAARARLPDDLAVLDFGVLPDRLVVIVLARDRAEVHTLPHSAATVTALADTLRVSLREGKPWATAAEALAMATLDPVRPALQALFDRGVTRLAVLPHLGLHGVPFEVLPWGDGLLLDHAAVFNAPNLTALDIALHNPMKSKGDIDLLAVGDAHLDLPGARTEVQAVAQLYDRTALKLGPEATLAALRQGLTTARAAHLAVHGVQPRPNAPAALELADGYLRAHEITELKLQAELVVLSVCDSARGTPNRGDEVLEVLDRAFLEAGARAVVASRWPVHDEASVLFTTHLHRARQAGKPLLTAFHEAQLALRAQGTNAVARSGTTRGLRALSVHPAPESYAHPYYWAAFSLRGDPR